MSLLFISTAGALRDKLFQTDSQAYGWWVEKVFFWNTLSIGLNNLVLLGWYNAVNRPERFVFEDLFDVDWCAYKRRRGNRKLNFAGHHNIFKVDIKGHWWWWKKFLDGLSSLAVMISQNTPSALSLWPNSINSINCFPRSDLNVKRDPLPTITNNLDSSSE